MKHISKVKLRNSWISHFLCWFNYNVCNTNSTHESYQDLSSAPSALFHLLILIFSIFGIHTMHPTMLPFPILSSAITQVLDTIFHLVFRNSSQHSLRLSPILLWHKNYVLKHSYNIPLNKHSNSFHFVI